MISFIKNFFEQKGIWVASSFFISKISAFLLTVFMARILSKEDFGFVMYGLNYLGFFLPLVGFGTPNGVMRFLTLQKDELQKKKLSAYTFAYGLVSNVLLSVIMLLAAVLLFGVENKTLLISVLCIRLFGVFILEQAKAELRGNYDNEAFAKVEIVSGVFLLLCAVVLGYFFGVSGYVASLCLSPYTALFFHRFRVSFRAVSFSGFSLRSFWKFCISMAFTNQLSELIFLLDVFFIGLFLDNAEVARYRVYSIIPFNLFVVATLFFQTSYPKLCAEHNNHTFQLHYLYNFWKLMLPIAIAILLVAFTLDQEIIKLFGGNYFLDTSVFKILILATIAVILLRVPFGYLLASQGASVFNLISAALSVIIILVSIKSVISYGGLVGVAWLSFFNLLFGGVFQMVCYFYFIKFKKNKTTNAD